MWCLLCAWHRTKCLSCSTTFTLLDNSTCKVFVDDPFYRRGNGDLENIDSFAQVDSFYVFTTQSVKLCLTPFTLKGELEIWRKNNWISQS